MLHWSEIPGWFQWRSAQEEAAQHFGDGSKFLEVGTYLGRSLCSLGEVVAQSRKQISVIGVDTCLGSGPEGLKQIDYHGSAVAAGGGTLAGSLHRNVLGCGLGGRVVLIVADSKTASELFADATFDWVHLDARHDYHSVKSDIAAWLPKIKRGGWLSGDDYDPVKWPDVVRAVAEALPMATPWSSGQWRYKV